MEARLQAALVAEGWDLYQAKHYEQRLTPGNAYPELVKFFGHLLAKCFPAPRKYYFCAPKNVGPELHDLLASPDNLRTSLLTAWKAGTHGLSAGRLTSAMEAFINAFDFKRFEECQLWICWLGMQRMPMLTASCSGSSWNAATIRPFRPMLKLMR